MGKSEKISILRKWLESGASDFDYKKSKLLLEKIYNLPDAQIDSIFRLYEESVQQGANTQAQNAQENGFFRFLKIIPSGIKTIFIIAIIASSIVMLYSHNKAVAKRITVTRNGDIITLEAGKSILEFEKIEDIDNEYRVFGITPDNIKDKRFNYLYADLMIYPLDKTRIAWNNTDNELSIARLSTLVSVIIPDENLRKKIDQFDTKISKQLSLKLKGELIEEKSHIYDKLNDLTGSIQISGVEHEIWLLSDAEEVEF